MPKCDLSASNIAGLGTELEKKVRQAAARGEPAWTNAGKEVGVEIWRIEQFNVVPWPKKLFGSFFGDDSYIILHTYNPNPLLPKMAHDIYFWIGETSSQDEYGTAAYKTVELDDFLGGEPVQHREVQFHESTAFRSMFPVLTYMSGGAPTGFHHVEPKNYRPRLMWVKGKGRMVVREVPMTFESLNDGDSFIYDGGLRLLVWHGREANLMEKTKTTMISQAINDERGGLCKREVFEHAICDETEWWKAIGGKGPIKLAQEAGDDSGAPLGIRRLMRLSDAKGLLEISEVASGSAIRRSHIKSDDVYILDDGKEVMVWVGRGASPAERQQGLGRAIDYLKAFKRPLDTPICRILEGGENEIFESFFEEAVTSLKRPGDAGARFTGDISDIRGLSQTKAVASSMLPTYRGSGGPGATADLDRLYLDASKTQPIPITSAAAERALSPPPAAKSSSRWDGPGGRPMSPIGDAYFSAPTTASGSQGQGGVHSGHASRAKSPPGQGVMYAPVAVRAKSPPPSHGAASGTSSTRPQVRFPVPVMGDGPHRVVSPVNLPGSGGGSSSFAPPLPPRNQPRAPPQSSHNEPPPLPKPRSSVQDSISRPE